MMELSLPGLKKSNLQSFITDGGGIDDFLFNGPKETNEISAELNFGLNGYRFSLASAAGGENVVINEEQRYYEHSGWWDIGSGQMRPRLIDEKNKRGVSGSQHGVGYHVYKAIDSWRIYHFHDTSKTSAMRRYEIVEDNKTFRFDGSNIAPFLLRLRENYPDEYGEILDAVRLVIPFFDDFLLDAREFGDIEKVRLSWRQKGSDYPMQPYHLSDGSIRFICLATALLQPLPPSTILIDEPELGLHPYAIELLAELVTSAAQETQVILSTQSPPLVDCFKAEDVIVARREDGASSFSRLSGDELSEWLDEYALGELWRKNVIAR